MIVLVLPSASVEEAVTPTVVPLAAFSSTVFAAALESVGADTSDSSKSVIEIVIVSESVSDPSALSALITMSQEVADS